MGQYGLKVVRFGYEHNELIAIVFFIVINVFQVTATSRSNIFIVSQHQLFHI